jgi:hypothetical protein
MPARVNRRWFLVGKKGLQLLALAVGLVVLLPAFSGAALGLASAPVPAASPAPPAPAPFTQEPAAPARGPTALPPAPALTPENPPIEAASADDALHVLLSRSLPRDNQNPDEAPRGEFAPVPLVDNDQNDINYARWLNGSSSWTGESVEGRNVGGFQRADVDWWTFPMGNVTSGSADVMEFDLSKEAGEQLYVEVRVYANFDYDNYGGPNTYNTVYWENMNSTQGWTTPSRITLTAFEANQYFLYIRSPLRNGCCVVNYTITNVSDYSVVGDARIDDNSNRTSADVFSPAAMPVDQEVEQNGDLVDVFDLTAQFSINSAAGDTARVNLNLSITDGRAGLSDFYNTSQMPAVTSEGDTISAAVLVLFYPDVLGFWRSYSDVGIKGDTLAINGIINGTPLYAAVYTYSVINVPVNPLPTSSVPGWVSYNFTGFWRTEDRAPTFLPNVPNVAMWEDDAASGQDLLNLAPFFTDDWDTGQMHFGIKYNQQPTIITPSFVGSVLSVTPISPNYWGNVTLQILGYDRGFDRIANTADDHATSSNYFTVNVRPVNDPPAITDIGGRANTGAVIEFKMAQGASLAITPTVVDLDGAGGFSFSSTALPGFATFTGSNGTFTFQPGNGDVGLHGITETVTDGTATAQVMVLINVSNVNDNPAFIRVGGVNVSDFPHSFAARQGELFSVVVEVRDLDWEIGVQDPINITSDKTFVSIARDPGDYRRSTASFTPTNAQVGLITVVFSVTDVAGGAFDDNVTVTIVVANANDRPFMVSLGTVSGVYNITAVTTLDLLGFDGAVQGRDFVMTVRADDIDVANGLGDALSFSTDDPVKFRVTAKPDGLSADITVRPNQTDATRGFVDVVVTVTDQGTPGLAASVTVHIGVTNINDPPVWNSVFSVNLTEGVAFAQAFTAFDPDGDPITYTSDAAIFTVDPASGAVELTPTNELIEGANYQVDVTFTARDNHNAASTMVVHFFIENVNTAPSGVAISAPAAGASFAAGEGIAVRGVGDDLDAEDRGHLTFKWFVDGAPAGTGPAVLVTVPNPDAADKTVEIRLQVTDVGGLSSNATVTVTVRGTPAPPQSPGFDAAFAVAGAAVAALAAAAVRRRKQP